MMAKRNSRAEFLSMEEGVSLPPRRPRPTSVVQLTARMSVVNPSPAIDEENEKNESPVNYLIGWRLHVLTLVLMLSLFLANFEVTIVSTSLVAIADDLKGFSESSWVVTAYMLTYTGFLIILAKLSDIFGRKLLMITSVFIFVVFSGACGGAQSMTQLIIFRAFQGIGGAGVYSIAMVIVFEMVPPPKYATYTAIISVLFTVSLVLGPLLGGVINSQTTWRWVFLLNVPAGLVAMVLLFFTLPANFPYHGQSSKTLESMEKESSWKSVRRIDFFGATLLLAASIFLVTALQQTGDGFSWTSPQVLTLLILSGPAWIGFLAWERVVSRDTSTQEPVFPWRFVKSRVVLGLILDTLFVGVLFTVCVNELPFRFEAINGVSTLQAGIRLLPFAIASPIGSIIAAIFMKKAKIPPIYFLFVGTIFQIVGLAFLSRLPATKEFYKPQYGFQVITGMGIGMNMGSAVLMTPFTTEKRDLAAATAAMVQTRVMGGALGLAIVTTARNSVVKLKLLHTLTAAQTDSIFQTTAVIETFPVAIQDLIRNVFADAFDLQMFIILGFAVAQIPATLLMWEREPIRIK